MVTYSGYAPLPHRKLVTMAAARARCPLDSRSLTTAIRLASILETWCSMPGSVLAPAMKNVTYVRQLLMLQLTDQQLLVSSATSQLVPRDARCSHVLSNPIVHHDDGCGARARKNATAAASDPPAAAACGCSNCWAAKLGPRM